MSFEAVERGESDDGGHNAKDVPRWPCEAGGAVAEEEELICILIRVGLEPWNEDVKGGAVDAEGLVAREVCQHPRV